MGKASDQTLTRVKIIIVRLREEVIVQGQEPLNLLNSDPEPAKQDLGLQVIKGKTLTPIIDLQAARRNIKYLLKWLQMASKISFYLNFQ